MEKKTKLTISGSSKKSIKNFDSSRVEGKKTVIIDKKNNRQNSKANFNKPFSTKPLSNFKKNINLKPNFSSKIASGTSDFERRKLAEQRATKRLKEDAENKDKKNKLGIKKREIKITKTPSHF